MSDSAAWLEKHTIQCRLGRITPAQCESNRKKPLVTVQLGWHGAKEAKGAFMPPQCESCAEWEQLLAEFAARGKAPEQSREHESISVKPESAGSLPPGRAGPRELCKCLMCWRTFEPYKIHRVWIEYVCMECMAIAMKRL